ncbi:hypothetical protein HZQ23_15830 [Elizabethkingia anophelis]|nr:hypothetical protein [Elizabethkingia anophelis]MCT3992376.1 hypothetical protein [Elizabethkingia anophelis]MCT4010378.1 hypothetical protein [Elizabethkingia anophelis]MDV2443645.1 hypothetical protein [Elizabethkingia anophelis]
MSDSAIGSVSGYLYQFERALLLLCDLENKNHFISIEKIDDIAIHSEEGSILLVEQDKHSILESGSTFKDTDYALWRTIQLWIEKLNKGIINSKTKLHCATNKNVPETSLLKFIVNNDFEQVKVKFQTLRDSQQKKLDNYKTKEGSRGKTVLKNLSLIDFALANEKELKIIVNNIELNVSENLKKSIITKLHIDSYSELQRNKIYDDLFGWLTKTCFHNWTSSNHAEISKLQFSERFKLCINSPSIINAIFRAKKDIDVSHVQFEEKKDELFVKQINCLKFNSKSKEHFIRKSIEDFIRYEIEHTHIISRGNLTKEDFLDFLENCKSEWENYFHSKLKKEIEEYSEEELSEIGLDIYTYIINDLKINFKNDINFNIENMYVKNGSFLKLSNIPEIGWHPNWEKLLSADDKES